MYQLPVPNFSIMNVATTDEEIHREMNTKSGLNMAIVCFLMILISISGRCSLRVNLSYNIIMENLLLICDADKGITRRTKKASWFK